MTDDFNTSRRDFVKGAATGAIGGTLAAMGIYSYSSVITSYSIHDTKLYDRSRRGPPL